MINLGFKHSTRNLVIVISNDIIGDGVWIPTISESLREYAIFNETVPCDLPHVYQSKNGNKLTVTGGTWCGELYGHEDLPHPELSQDEINERRSILLSSLNSRQVIKD